MQRFIDAVKPDGVAMIAGIIPLKSEKSGPWLNANLPGVVVPPDMLGAMDDAAREGRRASAASNSRRAWCGDERHLPGCAHHGHRLGSRSAQILRSGGLRS